MLPSWANDTVTIIRPASIESRGSTVPDWSRATETQVSGCSVQPAGTSLSQDGRVLGVMDGLTAYIPPGTDVQPGDRIRFDGEVYTIDGDPRSWKSATGAVSHILLNLKRWSG